MPLKAKTHSLRRVGQELMIAGSLRWRLAGFSHGCACACCCQTHCHREDVLANLHEMAL